uniref:Uncharacterized protein n=1 Tax=Chromera velia CCMP2878 TaxID=1169474 RepID=A0A0G4GMY3_9ALVE|mmetsp:Transcript_29011/g.56804  ORF Transcript_29011/g.56804 Transcript_29011/m.56804 type:complete len:141 (-) Transcript_29011:273-695(-)|eukprot:Cvel_4938.t1-p1 / transcript=Cvel_4938.t1 / gene=Cvel_4938 / organism=Chromera_velia_CCMP2878 / gene_product=hypothetical protein / transcript_product=hypothetical protein / location=Cvel_scaffold223:45055-46854(-) / protein_length=140 / sequence_SO=supercontig / SO=protein_coding / is_pseudo=false
MSNQQKTEQVVIVVDSNGPPPAYGGQYPEKPAAYGTPYGQGQYAQGTPYGQPYGQPQYSNAPPPAVVYVEQPNDDPTLLYVLCIVGACCFFPITLCAGLYGLMGHPAKGSSRVKTASWVNIWTFVIFMILLIIILAVAVR